MDFTQSENSTCNEKENHNAKGIKEELEMVEHKLKKLETNLKHKYHRKEEPESRNS